MVMHATLKVAFATQGHIARAGQILSPASTPGPNVGRTSVNVQRGLRR